MTVPLRTYLEEVRRDLRRYAGKPSFLAFCRNVTLCPGFKYTFWMRSARYFKGLGLAALPLYVGSRWVLKHYTFKYGISIPYNTRIGAGLYIGHFGQIFVNSAVTIGEDCNINQGVTIGAAYGGRREGVPVIGDRVYFGPGSKVFGRISVGNDVAIGANSVVATKVPDNAVVVGIPATVVSYKGSGAYVVNTGSRSQRTNPEGVG